MAGYSSDDGDYYSDGGWGEDDDSGYYSDDHSEQQEFGNDDNVSESHEGPGREDSHEEQDDDEGSHDENKGTEPEELNDQPGHQVGGYGVPGNVIVNPGQDGPRQTMTGSIGKQAGVDGERHPATSYEWSSRTRHQDKQTGDYARATVKHTFASGDTFKERSTGRVGFKDEHKQSTTITIGNKGGYSEYHREERLRTVEFGKSIGNISGGSSSGLTNKKK
ncbi:hypothetical protein BT93_C1488 [Corymbia citriodora subsp. variegata]|nr:hypothetical protein BT93_C1488 [Corymbia citriodora subsp. variegata]KAF8035474.1 hypothetical protein BT93_C1488 [Corymbia citriodora subsp. variegata]